MRFLDLFKTQRDIVKEEIIEVPWHVLGTLDQLDTIIEESKEMPVAIFKHSTRCGISRGVLKIFERNYKYTDDQVKLYFLDLLQNRDISNDIAARFKVRHESPQLLIIKNGVVVYHNSHHAIETSQIEEFLK
ncbi:MAG: bacillithiol system redox-active protein YtxJ [Aequorivita sp.]